MLEEGVAVEERFVGLPHRRVAVRPPARLDARDLAVDGLLVLGRLKGHVPDELGVEGEDPDLVPRIEEVDDEVGRLLGRLELVDLVVVLHAHGHRAGPIDDEHDGQAGDVDLLLDLHRDGEGFLDGRPIEAPETEALLPAQHDEPAPLVAHVVANEGHLAARHLERGDVGQDEAVVLLEPGHGGRQAVGRHDLHVDVLGAEGVGEVDGLVGLLVDEEHLGLPPDHGQPDGAVVLLDDVPFRLDQRLVDMHPRLLQALAVGQHVLPGVQPDDLGAEKLAVPVER